MFPPEPDIVPLLLGVPLESNAKYSSPAGVAGSPVGDHTAASSVSGSGTPDASMERTCPSSFWMESRTSETRRGDFDFLCFVGDLRFDLRRILTAAQEAFNDEVSAFLEVCRPFATFAECETAVPF
jgi:hypothetical protein